MAVELKPEYNIDTFLNKCLEVGLIFDLFLFNRTSFRIAPPLTITDEEIDIIIEKYCILDEKIKILLEYQMGPNDKSRTVASQILEHYSPIDMNFTNYCSDNSIEAIVKGGKDAIKEIANNNFLHNNKIFDIEIVGPSLKNKINFDKEKPLSFFINKYAKLYDANKAHSKSNFLKWVEQKNISDMTKPWIFLFI